MLELQPGWFLVLLVNFLVLLFVLNLILFKPLIKLFKEREGTVKGSLDAAKDMTAKKDSAMEDMRKGLSDAGLKARAAFEDLRAEGLLKQKETVSQAGADASRLMEEAKAALRQEAERARQALRADVEKFSDEIVNKMVKV
ncbi:MAG: hypothetical protein Q8J64_01455 [Thermodesulfovibrionales bacterium]|nr:hypothetical protein [Thermodesulfovibrionales bacterium]